MPMPFFPAFMLSTRTHGKCRSFRCLSALIIFLSLRLSIVVHCSPTLICERVLAFGPGALACPYFPSRIVSFSPPFDRPEHLLRSSLFGFSFWLLSLFGVFEKVCHALCSVSESSAPFCFPWAPSLGQSTLSSSGLEQIIAFEG